MSRRTKIVAPLVALLLLTGGLAAGVSIKHAGSSSWLFRDEQEVQADAGKVLTDADAAALVLVRQSEPLYYEFDPPITVNIKDTSAILQVGISLSTHFAETNDALKSDEPALRSAIIMALGNMPQDRAESDAGKEKMLSQIVSAVNAKLTFDGFPGNVDQAFFTAFLVQGQGD